MFIAIVIAVICCIAGLLGLRIGIRGRRLGDHPVCNHCGFDLRGRAEGSDRCPECGASLTPRRAIGRGDHQRRSGLVVAGAILLVFGLILGGMGAYWQIAGIKANHYKPVWWLTHDARSNSAAIRDSALAELVARMGAGTLSSEQIDSLAVLALAAQADQRKPWDPLWADFMAVAQRAGKLSPQRWQQYARQAYTFQLMTRPIVRRGDDIVLTIAQAAPRCRAGQDFWLDESFALRSTDIARDGFQFGMSSSGFAAGGSSTTSVPVDPAKIVRLADGPHLVKITVHAGVHVMPWSGGAKIIDLPVDLETTFNLVAAGAVTVSPINDESIRGQIEQSLKPGDLRWSGASVSPYIDGTFEIRSAPVDLAFKVILRSAGHDWAFGSIAIAKGASEIYGTGGNVSGLAASKVDIVLQPDIDAARRTVDLTTYWNHEIVFHDVRIVGTRPPPLPGMPATRAAGG